MIGDRKAGQLPPEHTPEVCEEAGCFHPYHSDPESGLCLACHGCGDPECCQHDEYCAFEDRTESTAAVET